MIEHLKKCIDFKISVNIITVDGYKYLNVTINEIDNNFITILNKQNNTLVVGIASIRDITAITQ